MHLTHALNVAFKQFRAYEDVLLPDGRSETVAFENRTVSLPPDQAEYIDQLVSTGAYANDGDVLRAGLVALKERDDAVERWLRDDVLPVAAAMDADPSLAIPAEEVFAGLRALHAERLRAGGNGL